MIYHLQCSDKAAAEVDTGAGAVIICGLTLFASSLWSIGLGTDI